MLSMRDSFDFCVGLNNASEFGMLREKFEAVSFDRFACESIFVRQVLKPLAADSRLSRRSVE